MILASPEAEQALVARLVVDQELIASVAPQLPASDFFDPEMRAIYGAMVRFSNEGRPIDVVTLRDEIGKDLQIPVLSLTPGHRAPVEAYVSAIRRDAFRRAYAKRLNNLSQRAEIEDDPQELMTALHDATFVLAKGIEGRDMLGRIRLEDYREPPAPPLLSVLSPSGTTIFYGDGGDGKGWIAARMVSELDLKVAILDFETQPQEWGYRLDKFGVSLDDVLYFTPSTTFDKWATEEAARALREAGVGFLVVDSAMYASNVDDPYSPAGALAYGRARRRLDNLPALLLAHTTGNADKVFGSVYWKNECRIAWRVGKDLISRQRHIECRKANGYSWLEGKRYEIEFNEDHGILKLHEHGKPWSSEQPQELVAAGEF